MSSFAARLSRWQKRHGRNDLPWQSTRDPYPIWVSEIMLQQTQVATVLDYYPRFLQAFPDLGSLAAASIEHVLELWSGLGYYRRAHLLHRAAQVIVADHGCVFPDDAARIGALPGVGRSTAAAIAAFAFGKPGTILDGNVKRVLARHDGIEGYPGDGEVEQMLWSRAEAHVPRSDIEIYIQALMDLGATICVRRQPRCNACPVARDCVARREGRVHELPAARPRKQLPRRKLTVLLIQNEGDVLVERRPPSGIWPGLCSLPELEAGVDVSAYCRERYGAEVSPLGLLPCIEHTFTHFHQTLQPHLCKVIRWPLLAQESGCVWLSPNHLGRAALPAPIKKFLQSRARSRQAELELKT